MTDTAAPRRKAGLTRFPVLATLVFVMVYGSAMLLLVAPKHIIGTTPAGLIQSRD